MIEQARWACTIDINQLTVIDEYTRHKYMELAIVATLNWLKADIHQKKVMLSVWWDFKGIVYFKLLPRNQTINSNVCSLANWLNANFTL